VPGHNWFFGFDEDTISPCYLIDQDDEHPDILFECEKDRAVNGSSGQSDIVDRSSGGSRRRICPDKLVFAF
jgi:hypothetical protein